jgi:hypothetical protein
MILMTINQHRLGHAMPAIGVAVWRAVRAAARALRAGHEEQVLMWDLFWQAGRVPAEREGALSWVASLDGPRLTGSRLPAPGDVVPGAGP